MPFVFYMHFTFNEIGLLKKDGARTRAMVLDRYSLEVFSIKTMGNHGIYNVVLEYSVKGKHIKITKSLYEEDYKKVHKYQDIDIIYSKKDPSMVIPLITEGDRELYKDVPLRNIN